MYTLSLILFSLFCTLFSFNGDPHLYFWSLTSVAADSSQPCLSQSVSGMSCIPKGSFLRGSNQGKAHARPQMTIEMKTYYMDQNEVTVAQYKRCVRQKKCNPAGPRYADFNRPKQPINGISWFDAVKYCKAQGKHLPTESEWEKAARGTDGRTYPWGESKASCKHAIIKDKSGRGCGVLKRGKKPKTGRVWTVGQKPPNQYGLYDMSGNSYEWVADWYSDSYAKCGSDCQGLHPLGPCGGKSPCKGHRDRVVRGGSWYWPANHATTYYRRAHRPSNRPFHHFGFRCAASLDEAKKLIQSSSSH